MKARLISSRFSAGVGPWKTSMRCVRVVGVRERRVELLHEVALRVVVFGEDENAQVVPLVPTRGTSAHESTR